jgi:AraC family transcriptional regulator, alkane utilization regulator
MAMAVAAQEAMPARSSQPGLQAAPLPPIGSGMSVLAVSPDGPAISQTGRRATPTRWAMAACHHCGSSCRTTGQATKPGPGNRAVLARLAELLFMEVVRWQLSHFGEGHRAWLAGLNDTQVGRALPLLHADPARAWTVEELAQQPGLSRSALAKRFTDLVGDTPIQYLAGWRMHMAHRLLREREHAWHGGNWSACRL